MGTIKAFFAERGFTLMVCGIIMAAAGVLFYAFLKPRYAAPFYSRAAMAVAIAGFAVYFTGRVSVAIQRSRGRRGVARAEAEDEGGEL